MRTTRNHKLLKPRLLTVALISLASQVFGYPPDNAAVLYYRAFTLYQVDEEMSDMLFRFGKGRIARNERIEEFLEDNRRVIGMAVDATRIERCDWGLDYSQGTEVVPPPLHKVRQLLSLMVADARMQAQRGKPREGLRRCLGIYRMARHLNERPILNYIVGIGLNAVGNDCIIAILSDVPQDTETLTWLRDELAELDKRPYSIEPTLRWKRQAGLISMSPEKIRAVLHSGLDDGTFKDTVLERIRTADDQFFTRNMAYWNGYMDAVQAAFSLPYPQGYSKLKQLDEDVCNEARENTDATLTAGLGPTWGRIYALSTRARTHTNAVRTGIELYLIKARTGRLPETLPAGLPTDLFSGKPFQYSKNSDGFVLRCQGKDLTKETIYDYEFKVKK
jgi:hypothetical protein